MSDSLKSKVAETATTLENVTTKVDDLAAGHDSTEARLSALVADHEATVHQVSQLADDHTVTASKLSQLEAKVAEMAEIGLQANKAGMFGSTAQHAGSVLQDVVDFLHWAFPTSANLPGRPSYIIKAEQDAANNEAGKAGV